MRRWRTVPLAILVLLLAVPAASLQFDNGLRADSLSDGKFGNKFDNKLDMNLDNKIEGKENTGTMSPADKAAAHAAAFEKDFTVELDMEKAHETGMKLGVTLDMDTDFTPVSFDKIKKNGLIESWNREHPDRAVLVGDQIVKVNNITWHHNSQTFAERIKGQFTAQRGLKEGAPKVLTLVIQRPRQEKQIRFQSQREDLRRQLYKAEFVAEVSFDRVLPHDPMGHAMGWKLNQSIPWEPPSISKIRSFGLIANYNKEHPDAKIYAGDEILQVNHVLFHHNASIFVDRLDQQFLTGRERQFVMASGTKNVFTLRIRRPRAVNDDPGTQVYTRDIDADIPMLEAGQIGWELQSSDGEPVTIKKIDPDGLLAKFNIENPEKALQVGDSIMKVNMAEWQSNSFDFGVSIDKELHDTLSYNKESGRRKQLNVVFQRHLPQTIVKEWTVEIPAEEGRIPGWQLNVTDDSLPVTVGKIRPQGALDMFNQFHREDQIVAGDTIIKVNDILWRQDSSSFVDQVDEQYSRSTKNGTMHIFLRRPAGVEVPVEDEKRPFFKEFMVELPLDGGDNFGWQLDASNVSGPVKVAKVRKEGAVATWNDQHPLFDIQVGDQISQVNYVAFQGNATQFMERINAQVAAARQGKAGTAWQAVHFKIQRPWRTSSDDGAGGGAAGAGSEDDDGAVAGSED